MRDSRSREFSLGIVGAGAMGSGIAHVAALGGVRTRLYDSREGAAAKAREALDGRLAKRVADGKLTAAERETTMARVKIAEELDALSGSDAVIEAVIEDLEVKRDLFRRLEAIVASDCILASNTSSLPIGAIAAGLDCPERVAGMHFFNPVPVMRLVEVIPGPDTTAKVIENLVALGERLGRQPVVVKDAPGFLVNFGGRAYTTEALAVLHESVARPVDIDAVMRDCCGFRMGPFELMDLTGMDVNFPVTRFIHETYFGDPRLRSTPLHRYMLETGQLGRKTKRGFYGYRDGASPAEEEAPQAEPARAAFLLEPTSTLRTLAEEAGLDILSQDDGVSPILAAPIGEDCSSLSARTGADHRRLVAVDLLADWSKRITLMTAPGCDPAVRAAVQVSLGRIRAVTAIADSPGFVAQRILAMVVNLGCEMAQIGLAAPADIDLAMRLGLNYPKGPLEFADALGVETVHRVLTELQKLTGDDRYRPSQWLRRRAQLGISATTP